METDLNSPENGSESQLNLGGDNRKNTGGKILMVATFLFLNRFLLAIVIIFLARGREFLGTGINPGAVLLGSYIFNFLPGFSFANYVISCWSDRKNKSSQVIIDWIFSFLISGIAISLTLFLLSFGGAPFFVLIPIFVSIYLIISLITTLILLAIFKFIPDKKNFIYLIFVILAISFGIGSVLPMVIPDILFG